MIIGGGGSGLLTKETVEEVVEFQSGPIMGVLLLSNGTYPGAASRKSQDDAPNPGNPSNARGGDVTFNFGGSGIVLTGKGGGFGGYFNQMHWDIRS